MSKNLITKPEVRKALVASGNLKPVDADVARFTAIATHRNTAKAESQAAAIAARRKELGIKPAIKQHTKEYQQNLAKQIAAIDPINLSAAQLNKSYEEFDAATAHPDDHMSAGHDLIASSIAGK